MMEKQNKNESSAAGRKWPKIALAAFCALIVLVPLAGVLGKYIRTMTAEGQVTAALFVAAGDYAAEIPSGGSPSPIDVSGWKDDIVLTLYNHKNGETSEVDITYTCQVPEGWTVVDGSLIETQNGISTFAGAAPLAGGANNSATIRLRPPASAKQGDSVSFSLTTAPFAVTMQATFVLADSREPEWTIKDMGAYTLITIHTNDYAGEITLRYNSKIFAPDSTNPAMRDWIRANAEQDSGSFTAERFTTYELRLFEEIPEEYRFTVGETTADLAEGEGSTVTVTATAP